MKKVITIILLISLLMTIVFFNNISKSKISEKDLGCNMHIDKKGVYQMVAKYVGCKPTERVERPELDAESFRIIDDNYALDKNHVYYPCTADKILTNADPKSFEVYKKGIRLAHDAEHVFYNDYLVIDGDPETYTEITSSFDKDKNNVYYIGKKIEGANPEYFKPISYGIGYDNKNIYSCYIECRIAGKIDFDSFHQLNDTVWQDKNNYYCLDKGKTSIDIRSEPCE